MQGGARRCYDNPGDLRPEGGNLVLQFDGVEEIGAPLDQSTDLVAFIGRQLALPDCREKVAERCGAVLWRRERAGGGAQASDRLGPLFRTTPHP